MYDLEWEVIFTSRDVVFQEDVFPYLTHPSLVMDFPSLVVDVSTLITTSPVILHDDVPLAPTSSDHAIVPVPMVFDSESETSSTMDSDTTEFLVQINEVLHEISDEQLGRGCRQKVPSMCLKD